ncbi:Rrf2 family transcriptional regulator [Clostridium estertheticum]|uniref:Rrf2 family transcriptional regulator n=1 Tax=Clostridium estertheticum TaxID=238834 RepID=UPI001C0E0F55|nr:Rrf2 family transcriptional regulator [Clostridium estertheticum]MBU3216508.1 Rrf2 family transcriptional regulator [Clostridium estertheticum]WAG54452.1 Rrf2 family transcriptional regulator [Clostridium estertheticum]
MKYSTKLSQAVHILVFIKINPCSNLSSTAIAKSIQTNPGCVRQIMMKLRETGLLNSVTGHAKPSLAKEAADITILDLYRAVEGNKTLLHLDTQTNPDCGVGTNIQLSLQKYYDEIQETAEHKMKEITLEHIIDLYNKNVELSYTN